MIESDNSYVVRKLKPNEIKIMYEELKSNDHLWAPHIPKKFLTALKDGKSIHLKYDRPLTNVDTDHWSKFPKTTKIIEEVADGERVERSYWHRLLPGDSIEKHTDRNIYYVKEDKIFARYQIYLDIPKDSYILLDDNVVENKEIFSNSIVNFNLRKYHAYKNNSDQAWYFLVFDVMK